MPTAVQDTQETPREQTQTQPRRATPQTPSQPNNNNNTKNNEEEDEWLFSCRCESAKSVSDLLSCLRHVSTASSTTSSGATSSEEKRSKGVQPVTVYCAAASLTFHVYGTARQSQASVDLQAGLFSEYHVMADPNAAAANDGDDDEKSQIGAGGEFCVNLSTVLECLHVLGTQTLDRTKLSLSYNRTTEIFKLELLEGEGGVLSTAAIPGMLPPTTSTASLALAFRSTPIVARMILKSEWLREALTELDVVQGATCCTVLMGPDGLELVAVGNLGECLISALHNQQTAIVSLECTKTEARSYSLNSFLSGMRGLGLAEESCISMNEAGMIAIQHQVLDAVGQGSPNFVDFIMTCLQDDDEDESTNRSSTKARSVQSPPSVAAHPYSLGWDEGSKPSLSVRMTPAASAANNSSKKIDDDEDDETDDGEEDDLPAISKVPLFGAIETTITPKGKASASRKKLRRRRRTRQDDDSDEPDASQALLEEEEPVLDVTARASTPPRRRRRIEDEEDGSSSPELVYK